MTKYALPRANSITSCSLSKKRKRVNFLPFCVIFLCLSLIVSGISYLNLLNEKATYGYKVAKLENKLAELQNFNQKLELTKISLEQTSRLEKIALDLAMVPSPSVDFLAPAAESVAVR